MTLRIGSLCTGYGGLDMAAESVLGGELAWVADNDPGACKILAHRFPSVPNLGDISATDWTTVTAVDVMLTGFPCTNVSCAGARAGLRGGNQSGVWNYCADGIGALRPSLVIIENVRGLHSAGADSNLEPCPWCMGDGGDERPLRASGAVLGDLADLGYDAEWVTVSASDAGAPHKRERVFIIGWPAADTDRRGRNGLHEWQQPRHLAAGAGECREGTCPGTASGTAEPSQDAHGTAGRERRQSASGQASSRRSRADAGGSGRVSAADAASERCERQRQPETAGAAEWWRQLGGGEPARPGACATADTDRGGLPKLQECHGGTLAGVNGAPRNDALGRVLEWGPYGAAIARWEAVLERPAPRPTEPGRTGERLSPAFVEWMMGLPAGWVTDVPGLSRNQQLHALGNGVVPQQAAMALRLLLGAVEAGRAA